MSKERLYLFDTTLRDGSQTSGVDFSLEDKALLIGELEALGLDYIEAGYPGANPTDTKLFEEPRASDGAKLTAFGMTKRPGRSLSNDPGFQAKAKELYQPVRLLPPEQYAAELAESTKELRELWATNPWLK